MIRRIELPDGVAEGGAPSSVLFSLAAAVLASALLLSGCNTAEGIGDDVEEAGEEIGDAID